MILFVGDKPSPRMKPGATAFEGAACEQRLRTWAKVIGARLWLMFNSDTDTDLEMIKQNSHLGHKIVAVGKVAAFRLSRRNIPHFKLPHPSGLNRQINDKAFIAKKLLECKIWLNS